MFETGPNMFEEQIIMLMFEEQATLKEALLIDFVSSGIDVKNVYDLVDYLELKLEDLDKVQYYMEVFTGHAPDVMLRINEGP